MKDIKYGQITDFVHFLVENSYKDKKDIIFVDATAGNGLDTLFLCNLFKNNGFVYAFDIQEDAINRTRKLLENNLYSNYELIIDSHENVLEYIKDNNIDAALFNLGYLPNSNKVVKTNYLSTINAIKNIMSILKKYGRIYICAYLLHDKGEEASYILDYISAIDKKEYNVIQIKLLNKENNPPEIFIIEKN
jgi:ubiquinone/menaquinone biosynthesis C-methylase UbiE